MTGVVIVVLVVRIARIVSEFFSFFSFLFFCLCEMRCWGDAVGVVAAGGVLGKKN